MKRIFLTFLICSIATLLYSQSVHFGTAAVSGEDEFKSYYSDDVATGRYVGASNSFPSGSLISVSNPRNGKSVTVTIVKRLSQPGLFLILSSDAGKAIDFPENDILDVQAVEKRKNEEALSSYAEDRPFSSDPDLNPSAELAEKESAAETVVEVAAAEDISGGETTDEAVADGPDPAASAPSGEEDSGESPDETVPPAAEEIAVLSPDIGEETSEETRPPTESSVNEYIPPVVMNSEGTDFEEGYDPLVLLESAAEDDGEDIPEVADETAAPAEALTDSDLESELPLPEKFDEADLPESFEPSLPGEVEESSEVAVQPAETEPEVMLETPDLEPDLMETEIDDLLISETVIDESAVDSGLVEIDVAEPDVGPIPEESETVVLVPDLELYPEVVEMENVAEPEAPLPVEEAGPVVIEAGEEAEASVEIPEMVIEETVVEEPSSEEPEVSEPVKEPEVDLSDVLVKEADEKEEKAPETEESDELAAVSAEEPPENVIYFLTPGDFRPPPRGEDKKEKEEKKDPEKKVVPLTVERSELEHMIVRELRNGGAYLQLGIYSSIDVLYSAIESISDAYPTIVLTQGEDEGQLYKLLIGPISRDEKGVVITRFRSLGYGDAFLYSPH